MSEPTSSTRQQCESTRADGTRCRGSQRPDSRFCFAHDPSLQEMREAARSKGGRNRATLVRSERAMPAKAVAVYEFVHEAMTAVRAGKLSPRAGSAIAALGRTALAALHSGEFELQLRQAEAERQRAAGESVEAVS